MKNRAHLVVKINCDCQAAHTPSAPTGQLEENLYVLTNLKVTDGAESLFPRLSRLAVPEQNSKSSRMQDRADGRAAPRRLPARNSPEPPGRDRQ